MHRRVSSDPAPSTTPALAPQPGDTAAESLPELAGAGVWGGLCPLGPRGHPGLGGWVGRVPGLGRGGGGWH